MKEIQKLPKSNAQTFKGQNQAVFAVISIFINVIIHEATSKDKSLKTNEELVLCTTWN